MERRNDYEQAEAKIQGERKVVKAGGHICKILKAETTKSKSGNEMLVIYFDFDDRDEQAGFFREKFDNNTSADKKWPNAGIHRLLVDDTKEKGKTNPYFKGFMTILEADNEGFKWNWEESELKGKVFGGVFRMEEYDSDYGRGKTAKIYYCASVEKALNAEIPAEKLLETPVINETEIDDDDLPF